MNGLRLVFTYHFLVPELGGKKEKTLRLSTIFLFSLFASAAAYSQDVSAKKSQGPEPRFRGWFKYYQQVAGDYQLYKGKAKDSDMRLTVSDHPLMTYTHPVQSK